MSLKDLNVRARQAAKAATAAKVFNAAAVKTAMEQKKARNAKLLTATSNLFISLQNPKTAVTKDVAKDLHNKLTKLSEANRKERAAALKTLTAQVRHMADDTDTDTTMDVVDQLGDIQDTLDTMQAQIEGSFEELGVDPDAIDNSEVEVGDDGVTVDDTVPPVDEAPAGEDEVPTASDVTADDMQDETIPSPGQDPTEKPGSDAAAKAAGEVAIETPADFNSQIAAIAEFVAESSDADLATAALGIDEAAEAKAAAAATATASKPAAATATTKKSLASAIADVGKKGREATAAEKSDATLKAIIDQVMNVQRTPVL